MTDTATLGDVMRHLRAAAHAEARALRPATPATLPARPRGVHGWMLVARCARCAAPLEHVAHGAPSPAGRQIAAVATCTACRGRHVIHATVSVEYGQPVGRGSRRPADGW